MNKSDLTHKEYKTSEILIGAGLLYAAAKTYPLLTVGFIALRCLLFKKESSAVDHLNLERIRVLDRENLLSPPRKTQDIFETYFSNTKSEVKEEIRNDIQIAKRKISIDENTEFFDCVPLSAENSNEINMTDGSKPYIELRLETPSSPTETIKDKTSKSEGEERLARKLARLFIPEESKKEIEELSQILLSSPLQLKDIESNWSRIKKLKEDGVIKFSEFFKLPLEQQTIILKHQAKPLSIDCSNLSKVNSTNPSLFHKNKVWK